MKKFLSYVLLAGLSQSLLVGCANRNKADIVDTKLENQNTVSGGQSVGVRDKEFVVQNKKNLTEELRRLQEEVREMEDRVYGTREYKTSGVWGKLRDCRAKSGNPKTFDAGPVERPSDADYMMNWKEDRKSKAAIEKSTGKLVAMNEADLDDTIKKLNKAKKNLQEKEDEIGEKLARCSAEIKK